MKHPNPTLPQIQKLLIGLSLIDRTHYLAGTKRRENNIEHTFSVATLCWYVFSKYKVDLDHKKILTYALAHDFVERYAGDTNTFASASQREEKVKREADSLKRLATEFKDFPELIDAMRGYEAKEDEESKFVWTIDKMQQLIMGDLDKWRTYKEVGVSYDQLIEKHNFFISKSSKYCKQIYTALLDYSVTTYYDQPKVK